MQTVELVEHDPDTSAQVSSKQACFERLMSARGNYPNDFYLARILSSWINGDGVLPASLSLSTDDFKKLMARHFDGNRVLIEVSNKPEFDRERIPEWEDLVNLMVEFRAGDDPSEPLVAQIVAAACMGLDHLWQDLGLWSRGELTEVLRLNFPELAKRNNKDMKWKKFLYKQLCERDGTYVCRAPSCDVCADYQVCFGPEE